MAYLRTNERSTQSLPGALTVKEGATKRKDCLSLGATHCMTIYRFLRRRSGGRYETSISPCLDEKRSKKENQEHFASTGHMRDLC
jgi:hypothetical protein